MLLTKGCDEGENILKHAYSFMRGVLSRVALLGSGVQHGWYSSPKAQRFGLER